MELISLIESVGFCAGRHYLYCRVKTADGRGKLVPIEHGSEVEKLVSLHNNEKTINLCVFREKPSVDIATQGSHLDDESGTHNTYNTDFNTYFPGHILMHALTNQ